MTRRVFALDLVQDAALIAAYEARHMPGAVWPEVIQDIRDRGFLDMEIWRVADRLVMIAEVNEQFPGESTSDVASLVSRWEAEMDVYQRPVQTGGPKWAPMQRIFALSEQ